MLSYSVAQRRAEIGIRMALRETRRQIQARVLGRTMALGAVGVLVGGAGAFMASRVLGSMLYEVEPGDPLTFGGMSLVLLAVAALAGYAPAARASRTDPMEALRTS